MVIVVARMVPGCVPDGARGTDHRGRGDGVGEPGLGRAADQSIFREPDKMCKMLFITASALKEAIWFKGCVI